MATVYICNIHEMPGHVARLGPSHLISVLTPADMPDTPPGVDPDRHLRVACHDIVIAHPGAILPSPEHVSRIVRFAESWGGEAPMMIHCWAGVSRSTAAALIIACARCRGREEQLARRLRLAAPHAQPNSLMIAVADQILGCDGALVRAVGQMGLGGVVERGPLVEFNLLDEG
jgi:predicted protein tyrosine phosphatase